MNRYTAHLLCIALAFAMAACGTSNDGSNSGGDTNANGGTNGGGTNGGGTNTNGGGTNSGTPAPDRSALDSGLDDDKLVLELSEDERAALCQAVGAFEASYADAISDYRCLQDAFGAASVSDNPELTCERFRSLCSLAPLAPELAAAMCETDFDIALTNPDSCLPTTVDAFEACVVANLTLELAVADRGELTCQEAVTWEYILPDGHMDCACGRPTLLTDAPEDDLDRDGVTNDQDACPGTLAFVEVNAAGCSVQQDPDQDGVPSIDDACPDTEPDPVALDPRGCSFAQRDADSDGVEDRDDLCPGTQEGAQVSAVGCSLAQDGDQDLIPDDRDRCPGTEPDPTLVTAIGCSPRQDEDLDDVPNRLDICPLTPSGAEVDFEGCSPEQRAAPPGSALILDALPEDTTTFTLDPRSPDPIRISALNTSIVESVGGYAVEGTLMMEIPDGGGYMLLPNSQVMITPSVNDILGDGFEITGEMPVPFPAFGPLGGATFNPPVARVGFARGDSDLLANVAVPLIGHKYYLWFSFDTSMRVTADTPIGDVDLNLTADRGFVFVLDITDPFFSAQGNLSGLGLLGTINNAAIAFSAHKNLYMSPAANWFIEDRAYNSQGHLYVAGDLPINPIQLPNDLATVSAEGELLIDLDPSNTGSVSLGADNLAFLANGSISASLSIIPQLPLSFTMTQATFGGRSSRSHRELFASGIITPDNFDFFPGIPLRNVTQNGMRAGMVASDVLAESSFTASGRLAFDPSSLAIPFPGGLQSFEIDSFLRADFNGVYLSGSTRQQISGAITYEGDLAVEIFFGWSGDWSVHFRGRFNINGESNDTCSLLISNEEFTTSNVCN